MANAMRGALKHNGVYMLPYTDNIPCDPAPTENSVNYLTSGVVFTVKTNLEALINEKLPASHDTVLSSHAAGFNHDLIMTVSGRKVWLDNDGTNFKILYSDVNGATWNSRTPFNITFSTGDISLFDGMLIFNSSGAHFFWTITCGASLDLGVNLDSSYNQGGGIFFHWQGSSTVTSSIEETASGRITVSGNLSVGTDLSVGRDLSIVGDLTVGWYLTVEHDLTVNGDLSVGNDLSVGRDLSIVGDLTVGWYLTVGHDLTVNGNLTVVGNLYMSGGNGQRKPKYSAMTDVTSAWANGSWTASADGWILIGTATKDCRYTLYVGDKPVFHIGNHDEYVMTAYPIPVNGGETYRLLKNGGSSGYSSLATGSESAPTSWAYFIPAQ